MTACPNVPWGLPLLIGVSIRLQPSECARHTISAFRLCGRACLALELGGKGDVVEKGPRVVELVIPCSLQILHRLEHPLEFFVSDERQEGGGDSSGTGFAWSVGIGCSHEIPCRLSRSYSTR